MTRLIIGLLAFGLITLYNTFPAYAWILPGIKLFDNTISAVARISDTVTSAGVPKEAKTELKAPEEALTLSRFKKDGLTHILAVLTDDGNVLTGVDLSDALHRHGENSFDVISSMTYDELVKLIRSGKKETRISYNDLLPSVAGHDHLAIGINYAEHGKETGQVRPFMFPKFIETDPAIHHLAYTDGWLLDHEVELGVVFPSPVCTVKDLDHMMIGFLVTNDFTDRATLMREMDSQNVVGGKGFPDAKSKKGFLPTGPYLVIPRNWRGFVKELQLKLTVNGNIRQHGNAKDMVWNIEKIVERSLSVKGQDKSYYGGKMVKLFEGSCIPSNSIIITGTPAGVVFNAPGGGFIFGTVSKYIFTGAFFSQKMHPYILQQYLKKEMDNPRYLKPGDHVVSSISYLGTIRTTVVKAGI